LGRLEQGVRDIKGTDTIVFIPPSEIPKERTITYGRLVCDIRPHKAEQHRVRLTGGGDRINYPGEKATKNADLTTSKCLWNSTISTPGTRYMCTDVKNFYLNTLLERPEYMQLALTIIPQEIIYKYKLMGKERNGKVYIRIDKGTYGLPQAGRLANNLLSTRLAPHGYTHADTMDCLFKTNSYKYDDPFGNEHRNLFSHGGVDIHPDNLTPNIETC
jgi:hypothetical protein